MTPPLMSYSSSTVAPGSRTKEISAICRREDNPGRGSLTTGGSHLLGGPGMGAMVGPVEISSNIRARVFPLRYFLSLPQTCHQKFSKRFAVGSISLRNVVVYTVPS